MHHHQHMSCTRTIGRARYTSGRGWPAAHPTEIRERDPLSCEERRSMWRNTTWCHVQAAKRVYFRVECQTVRQVGLTRFPWLGKKCLARDHSRCPCTTRGVLSGGAGLKGWLKQTTNRHSSTAHIVSQESVHRAHSILFPVTTRSFCSSLPVHLFDQTS